MVKVIGVEGEMLPNHAGQVTQDFIFDSASTFHSARAKDFLKSITLLDKHADDSEALKKVVSSAAQTAEEGLELVGEKSPFLIGFGGHPPTHPLGETYHTAVPLRFGDYFGKMHLVPLSSNLTALRGKYVDHPDSWNCVKDSIVTFSQTETAVWELRVQLCTDLTRMPVDDASVEWDEHLGPSLTMQGSQCNLKMRIRLPAEYGLTSSSALTLGIVWPRIAPSATSCVPGSRHTKHPVTFAIA
jgi:hypothetical protein